MKNKKVVAERDAKSHSPQKNSWQALRAAREKTAPEGGNFRSFPKMVRLLGRYLNSAPEVARLRDLCNRAAGERVERTYSPPDRAVPRLTMSQNDEIVKLYRGGMRPADIAREIGTSEWTIHHRLNRMGVERRPTGMSPAQVLEAKRLYESGETIRRIRLTIGFSDATIKKALITAGVEVQDRQRRSS